MIWTYRVLRDDKGRYSVREVFYERDGTLITYGKAPAAPIGGSPEELLQLTKWFREAFDLPILSIEALDAQLAAQPTQLKPEANQNISLEQLKAELALEAEPA